MRGRSRAKFVGGVPPEKGRGGGGGSLPNSSKDTKANQAPSKVVVIFVHAAFIVVHLEANVLVGMFSGSSSLTTICAPPKLWELFVRTVQRTNNQRDTQRQLTVTERGDVVSTWEAC